MQLRQALRRRHIAAPDVDAAWHDFARRSMSATGGEMSPAHSRAQRHRTWAWISTAASVVLIVLLAITIKYLSLHHIAPEVPQQIFAHVNELPEVIITDRATGQVYRPEKPVISFLPDAIGIAVAEQPHTLTLRVPRGTMQQLTLPDGTEVWLNSDSELSFPDTFTGNERVVRFTGEAYFRVAKDAQHPFRIEAPNFSTIVLGTEFNIRAYDRDASMVSLVEGSVTFSTRKAPIQGNTMPPVLKPGQTAYIGVDGGIHVEEREAYSFVQWRENLFYFNDTPLRDVIREMGRWYNVDIFIENPTAREASLHIHFAADRQASLQEALDNLNDLGLVHASLTDNQVRLRILSQSQEEGTIKISD